MKYSKKKVNDIVDEIMAVVYMRYAESDSDTELEHNVEMIKEKNLLMDRRISSLDEYIELIVFDFYERKFSYKELMKKYHCAENTVKSLLIGVAHNDARIANEIDFRKH